MAGLCPIGVELCDLRSPCLPSTYTPPAAYIYMNIKCMGSRGTGWDRWLRFAPERGVKKVYTL